MKKRITIYNLIATAVLVLTLTGCNDFFDVKPQDVTIEDDFWNEKADVDQMIGGLYTQLQSTDVVKRMMVWGEFRSDNVTAGNDIDKDNSLQKVFKEDIDASNGYTTWTPFYYIINSCNTIIDHAPAVAATDPAFSESELNADIAEASAIRDLCYFYLIRTFRDVPYTTTAYADDDQVMDLPATKFDDVLDSLILDLESVKNNAVKAYPSYSATKAKYQTGRITQDAIHAMLCDMYLWKKDYAKCIEYADLVINSMKQRAKDKGFYNNSSTDDLERVSGFPLVSDQLSNTTYGNAYNTIFGDGNSMESIFELTYMRDDNMPSNGAANDFYMRSKGSEVTGFAAPSTYVGGTEGQDNQLFSKYDGRYYENMRDGKTIAKGCYSSVSVDYSKGVKDVDVSQSGFYAEGKVKCNWIIYRLSDVMLMKAEALTAMMSNAAEMSDQDKSYMNQAFSLVNAVNKRSMCENVLKDTLKATDYTTKEKIENLVMSERQRELMFEGKRWYDLVCRSRRDGNTQYLREQTLMKFTTNTSAISGKLAKMDYIYWPYNIDELKVNKNLIQNPAFGSGEDSNISKTK